MDLLERNKRHSVLLSRRPGHAAVAASRRVVGGGEE
jgi:hypothetical protein